MIKGTQRRRVNVRARQKSNPQPLPMANVLTVTHGTSQVTVVFDSPVQIAPGVMPSTWVFGATPRHITSIASVAGSTIVFNVSGTVAASDPYIIGPQDPAARTSGGGFVNPKSGTMS